MISYAISDPLVYSQNQLRFKKRTQTVLKRKQPTYFLLRDKQNPKLYSLAKSLKALKFKKFLISQEIEIARKFNFFGVHLTSSQLHLIPKARRAKLFVVVSTHSVEEIKKAKKLRANLVTFSPIFPTPNKGEPKGVKVLRKAKVKTKFPILALGGVVSKKEVAKIKNKAAGFASIRYF
ncbi:MAG: thiamine phosphate synthase [Epsilonproteobacteria bacterium]|nr:thiamine phosphate synthase [Campylobacterota bacterium]